MDDASLERACAELVAAAVAIEEEGGVMWPELRERIARAAEVITPAVERQVRAAAARHVKLLRDARLEPEDVAQEVLRRLLESPPRNPEGRDPVAAVLGWARAVAHHVVLDRRRRVVRETDPPAERGEHASSERSAEELLSLRGEIARMLAESEGLATHKYLRETFRVLVADPDVTALELAQRVGLIDTTASGMAAPDYAARAKKAAQYAWKLRQRMLDLLAARMGEARRSMTEKQS